MMKGFLIRLFIKFPLFIIYGLCLISLIVPIIYWIFTGKNYIFLSNDIEDIDEE